MMNANTSRTHTFTEVFTLKQELEDFMKFPYVIIHAIETYRDGTSILTFSKKAR
jgi:hypothetical protein